MVNKKIRFISRFIMCGLIMIMAAGVGSSVKASENSSEVISSSAGFGSGIGIQPLNNEGYGFVLGTYGEVGQDFDVSVMRKKDYDTYMLVDGLSGDDYPIIVWAVGHHWSGYYALGDCIDCSNGHTYKLMKDNRIYMYNEVKSKGCSYVAIAGQATVEYPNYIQGRYIPDYGY